MTGEEFRARRKALGLSQRELGVKMGYSRSHIARIESGERRVTDVAENCLWLVENDVPKYGRIA